MINVKLCARICPVSRDFYERLYIFYFIMDSENVRDLRRTLLFSRIFMRLLLYVYAVKKCFSIVYSHDALSGRNQIIPYACATVCGYHKN